MQQNVIDFVAKFQVEKKVPNCFIVQDANVAKTKHAFAADAKHEVAFLLTT